MNTMKQCTKCLEFKSLDEFGRDARFIDGKRKQCKSCRTLERQMYPKWYRWRDFKTACKKNGKELGLTEKEFLSFWNKPCVYCGDIIPTSNLDRLDNSRGYFMDNVVPCCITCNKAKSTLSAEEYMDHCRKVLEHNNRI